LQVGRTDSADLAIESDKLLSRLHFAIDCEPDQCRIRDLGSRNGTFLNGALINVASLQDGDRIIAGETEFQVTVRTQPMTPAGGESKKTWTRERLNKKTDASAVQPSNASPIVLDEAQRMAMQTFVLPSIDEPLNVDELTMTMPLNLFQDRPASAAPIAASASKSLKPGFHFMTPPQGYARPLDLARSLTSRHDFYMLINLQNMEHEARSYFLSPIQGKRFLHISPGQLVLVSSRDEVDCFELFRRAWGRDAMIGVISNASPDRIAMTIRNYENSYRHPTTLRADIEKSPPEGVNLMFSGIDAVLVESESVDSWALIVSDTSSADLSQFQVGV
jgi:pSer/pThr/pTyr-binding forkhead associated (FHA) protein